MKTTVLLGVLTLGIGVSSACLAQSVGDALRQNPQASITISGNGEVKVGGQPASLKTDTGLNGFSSDTEKNSPSQSSSIKDGVMFTPDGKKENIGSMVTSSSSLPQALQNQALQNQALQNQAIKPSQDGRMMPPVAPPTSLPPLPGMPKGNQPPLPPTQIPPPQDLVGQEDTLQNI